MSHRHIYFSYLMGLCFVFCLAACSTAPVQTITTDNSTQKPRKILVIGLMGTESDRGTAGFDTTLAAELGKCGIEEQSLYRQLKPQALSLSSDDEEKDFQSSVIKKKQTFQPDALLEVTVVSTKPSQSLLLARDLVSAQYDINLSNAHTNKVFWHGSASNGDIAGIDSRKTLALNLIKRMKESGVLTGCADSVAGGSP